MAQLRGIPRTAQDAPPDGQDKHDPCRRARPALAPREGRPCNRDRRSRSGSFPLEIPIDVGRKPLPVSAGMRLLVEIVIVATLIYLGWNRPFKEWAAQGSAMATSRIHAPAWEDHSATPMPAPAKRNPR